MKNSYLPDIFAEQTALPTTVITLSTVAQGAAAVCARLQQEVTSGKRIIVIDSVSDDNIELIACAVAQSGVMAVSVDPGPFTQKLFPRYAGLKRPKAQGRILVIAGSVTDLTRTQVDHLAKSGWAQLISLNAFDGLKITTKDGLIGIHDNASHCIKYMTQRDGKGR